MSAHDGLGSVRGDARKAMAETPRPERVTLTDDRLDAIRARIEAATPGPWEATEGDLEGKPASEYVRTLLANREADGTSTGELHLALAANPIDPERGGTVVPALTGDGPQARANAEFIAHAREDVPALLAEVERLAAREQALREEIAQQEGATRLAMRTLSRLLEGLHSLSGLPDDVDDVDAIIEAIAARVARGDA